MSIFLQPYQFAVINDLANEREAEAMVDLIKAFAKGVSADEFLATVSLATATLVAASCFDEHSACQVSNYVARYVHDAAHTMFGGEPTDDVPTPTVPDVGTA